MIHSSETLYGRLRAVLPLPQKTSLLKLHLYGDRNGPNARYSVDGLPYRVQPLEHAQYERLHAALCLPKLAITAHAELKPGQLAVVTCTFHPEKPHE